MATLRIPVAPELAGLRLDVFLGRRLKRSRSSARALARHGAVRSAAGRALKPGSRLRAGEVVLLQTPPRPPEPEAEMPLRILYEDGDLLAVDKPAGFPVHPAGGYVERSLVRALRRRQPDRDPGAPVHRLDRDTTGVVLFARTRLARSTLGQALAAGAVRKIYLALVEGAVPRPGGVIDAPLGDAGDTIAVRQAVRAGGRDARTRFRLVTHAGPVSLVAARPLTGRTHQIRVHLAWLGHPLCGDRLYGPRPELYLALRHRDPDEHEAQLLRWPVLRRHGLHAAALDLRHPRTGARLRLRSPLPADMAELLSLGRNGTLP